jgi:hypothetical protein
MSRMKTLNEVPERFRGGPAFVPPANRREGRAGHDKAMAEHLMIAGEVHSERRR